jgi:hypothetical protein
VTIVVGSRLAAGRDAGAGAPAPAEPVATAPTASVWPPV